MTGYRIMSRRLDPVTGGKGSGAVARKWIYELPGLTRAQKIIGLVYAYHCNDDGEAWPSRKTVAEKSGFSLRHVQTITEELIGLGLLVETGMAFTRGKRTRRYRLPVGGDPMPVMPTAARRRQERAAAGVESAKVHFQTGRAERAESAASALSRPIESAASAHNHRNMNQGIVDGGGEGAAPSPAPPPPAGLATHVKIVAARGAGMTEIGRWWEAAPVPLVSAADRPSRLAGQGKDWRRRQAMT